MAAMCPNLHLTRWFFRAAVCAAVVMSPRVRAGNIFDDNWMHGSNPPPPQKSVPPGPASTTLPIAKPSTVPAATAPVENTPFTGVALRDIPPRVDQARSRKLMREIFANDLIDHF